MKEGEHGYPITFRLVRIKIKGLYETLVTNLSDDEFDTKEIKQLYSMRWSIETAFRDIKFSLGLVRLQTKKYIFLKMKILCRMIMYNFIQSIVLKKSKEKFGKKHEHKTNFTAIINVAMEFYRGPYRAKNLDKLIETLTLSVRKERNFLRKFHSV